MQPKDLMFEALANLFNYFNGTSISDYASQIDYQTDVLAWKDEILNSDSVVIKNKISEIWMIPGAYCELEEEF